MCIRDRSSRIRARQQRQSPPCWWNNWCGSSSRNPTVFSNSIYWLLDGLWFFLYYWYLFRIKEWIFENCPNSASYIRLFPLWEAVFFCPLLKTFSQVRSGQLGLATYFRSQAYLPATSDISGDILGNPLQIQTHFNIGPFISRIILQFYFLKAKLFIQMNCWFQYSVGI